MLFIKNFAFNSHPLRHPNFILYVLVFTRIHNILASCTLFRKTDAKEHVLANDEISRLKFRRVCSNKFVLIDEFISPGLEGAKGVL